MKLTKPQYSEEAGEWFINVTTADGRLLINRYTFPTEGEAEQFYNIAHSIVDEQ